MAEIDNATVMQDDLTQLMEEVGIPTHARPVSPHEVMQKEVIPWVKRAAWGHRYIEALESLLSKEAIDLAVTKANGEYIPHDHYRKVSPKVFNPLDPRLTLWVNGDGDSTWLDDTIEAHSAVPSVAKAS